ncbi:MAG TPA: ferritin-like domain-containing protein [Kofleriaceae bacterium]|nr:ferritin-like domain-containing protein [Kofleriaceae bacterium]
MSLARDIVVRLNDLIQLDHDAVAAYGCALAAVVDPAIRLDLEAFRTDHERHVADLNECVRTVGGVPRACSSAGDGVGPAVVPATGGTEGVLRALRAGAQLVVKAYDDALQEWLPEEARDLVARHRDDERRHLAAIEGHLDRLRRAEPPRDARPEPYRPQA